MDAQNAIATAVKVIETAMQTQIPIEKCNQYIDKCTFGLIDGDKVAEVRSLVKARLQYEYKKNPTLWALSQTYSYLGTHDETIEQLREEKQKELQSKEEPKPLDLSEAFYDRLKEESFILMNGLLTQQVVH